MIRLRTGCKINLGLKITGIRPDGYHELDTLFYPLKWPADDIIINPSNEPGLHIECENCSIAPQSNLLWRAWQKFPRRPPGLRVKLIKRIPVGAGLGGGSADVAAFLKWLDSASPQPAGQERLASIAAGLGADVPFFLNAVPCRARGIGEMLKPEAASLPGEYILLVWPGIAVSTAWAFAAWDQQNRLTNNNAATTNSDSAGIDLRNDMESPVFARWPILAALKQKLLALGAEGAAMTGSGSIIYGIFANRLRAQSALTLLRRAWPRVYCLRIEDFGM